MADFFFAFLENFVILGNVWVQGCLYHQDDDIRRIFLKLVERFLDFCSIIRCRVLERKPRPMKKS